MREGNEDNDCRYRGVGGYIAGMVGQKYKNLTLIARGKRGEALREHGVVLHSDFHGEKIVKDGVIRECAKRKWRRFRT
ncbi:MAG: hypothetical protein ACLUUO_15835 [Sellimonas intestinalis]